MQLFENLTGQEMEDYTISLDDFERAEETDKAEHMAEQMCIAFMYHDRREWGMGVRALYQTERLQFPFLSTHDAYEVARLYMKALWEKDVVEAEHIDGLDVDVEGLRNADWSPVVEPLVRRAELVGADPLYGVKTAAGWCEHKVGGDYWTPMMQAQHAEIRAAVGDPEYPEKPKYGQAGFGHLPAVYIAGVDCHDFHTESHWRRAVDLMTLYFQEILDAQPDEWELHSDGTSVRN